MALKTSLSSIMIITLVSLFVFMTSFNVYTTLITDNGGSNSGEYDDFYSNMSTSYNEAVVQANDTSDEGIVRSVLKNSENVVFGGVNIFIIGLSAIGTFFEMIPILSTIIQSINELFPQFTALLGLLTVIVGFYIGMRFIKSARGTAVDI